MGVHPDPRAITRPRRVPREKVAAAVRGLILLTVFLMARLQEAPRSQALDVVLAVGALYVLVTTIFPMRRGDARRATVVLLAVDVLLITALVYTQNGIRSEYYLLYYLPVLQASVRLNFRDAVGTCLLSALCYLLVGVMEGMDQPITASVMSRVATFALSAGLLATFFMLLSREQRAYLTLSRHYQEAMKAKSEFLSRVSHEFRTPLTAIVGFSQLLYEHQQEVDPGREQEYLSVIREQAQHLARMIEDMLDLSRIDEGRLQLHRGPVNLAEAIESATMLLDQAGDRERVEVFVEPHTPAAWADRNEIEQVFARLLYNILSLSDEPAPLSVRVGPAVEEDALQVSLRSAGLAPDDERFGALFTPASAPINERTAGGHALGLAVARALIELHGGALWVDDTGGEDVAICFTLPRYRTLDAGPEVIIGTAGRAAPQDPQGAEAHAEGHDSGRRPVSAEAHARESAPLGG